MHNLAQADGVPPGILEGCARPQYGSGRALTMSDEEWGDGVRQTVVAVNAHPDDEAILMGGTLARMSAEGHRVILVTATDGGAGPTAATGGTRSDSASSALHRDLGARRLNELHASAAALGAAEVIDLGYADSGMGPADLPAQGERQRLHTVPIEMAAGRVANIVTSRSAKLVIGYDSAGGYGHRDHVHIHHIVRRAVQLSSEDRTAAQHSGVAFGAAPRLIEATAPREPILRALEALARLRLLGGFDPQEWARAFTPRAQITHRVDVRNHLCAKRAALAAHASQAAIDSTLARVLALPGPLFTWLLGREFFIEPARRLPGSNEGAAFADVFGEAPTACPSFVDGDP